MLDYELDADAGGRISSVRADGRELLWVDRGGGPMQWGAFAMVPFTGRLRNGRFLFAGRRYSLPCNLGAHAIHGTAFTARWDEEPDHTLVCELGDPWPFGGWVRHRVERPAPDTLVATLTVANDRRAMPAQAGWHPWFARPVTAHVRAGAMYRRDGAGIPDGTLLRPPPPGPWDDCFVEVTQPVSLDWDGGPHLELGSSCDHWVVFDQMSHALCVEPQSGPPDGFNLAPFVVEPGHPLVATMTLTAIR